MKRLYWWREEVSEAKWVEFARWVLAGAYYAKRVGHTAFQVTKYFDGGMCACHPLTKRDLDLSSMRNFFICL